jgi:hypothetical protein
MKVWARNPTRGAGFADDLPFFQLLPNTTAEILLQLIPGMTDPGDIGAGLEF